MNTKTFIKRNASILTKRGTIRKEYYTAIRAIQGLLRNETIYTKKWIRNFSYGHFRFHLDDSLHTHLQTLLDNSQVPYLISSVSIEKTHITLSYNAKQQLKHVNFNLILQDNFNCNDYCRPHQLLRSSL